MEASTNQFKDKNVPPWLEITLVIANGSKIGIAQIKDKIFALPFLPWFLAINTRTKLNTHIG